MPPPRRCLSVNPAQHGANGSAWDAQQSISELGFPEPFCAEQAVQGLGFFSPQTPPCRVTWQIPPQLRGSASPCTHRGWRSRLFSADKHAERFLAENTTAPGTPVEAQPARPGAGPLRSVLSPSHGGLEAQPRPRQPVRRPFSQVRKEPLCRARFSSHRF